MTLFQRIVSVVRIPFWYLYAAGTVVLVVSAGLWFARVWLSPERAFWGMLENSLSSSGVTVDVEQTSGQNRIKQVVQTQTGLEPRVRSVTVLMNGGTQVKTEIIGTPTADYTRYQSIRTDQKNAEGKSLDLAKVVNVWAKGEELQPGNRQRSGMVAQTILGVGLPLGSVPVPFGNVGTAKRQQLMDFIRAGGVYGVSFKSGDVTKKRVGGRLEYAYVVHIQTVPYAQLMKSFAQSIGMKELDGIDPNDFYSANPIRAVFTVDALSRRLTRVELGQQGYVQTYSSQGLNIDIPVPSHTISASDLQQRVQAL